MMEVSVPGNGYCFSSSVLVCMAALGLEKDFSCLSLEIMDAVKRTYLVSQPGIGKMEYVRNCAAFFEQGIYDNEFADDCINSAANALGINLYIVQRVAGGYVLFKNHCYSFKSKVNIFVLYHKSTSNAHYNAIICSDFWKNHRDIVESHFVLDGIDDRNKEDIRGEAQIASISAQSTGKLLPFLMKS